MSSNTMTVPACLKSGDKVALVAPSGVIDEACLQRGIRLLEKWGLIPVVGKNVLKVQGVFAGSDTERLEDLQWALDAEEISAVFCCRGGYGSARIVDSLDFRKFRLHPKWVVGFSDITVFTQYMAWKCGVVSLHAPMPQSYPHHLDRTESVALQSLHDALFGHGLDYRFSPHPYNREGRGRGKCFGGNLSVLYSLRGTSGDFSPRGKILFIEDLCEYAYHIDRMLSNLYRGGWFQEIAGLVVGQFTDIRQGSRNFEKEVYQMIQEYTRSTAYPIIYDAPIGHIPENRSVYVGMDAEIQVVNTLPEPLARLGFLPRAGRLSPDQD